MTTAAMTKITALAIILAACMASAADFDICATTEFKDTCRRSLTGATSTQAKDLIKAALAAANVELRSVVKNVAAYETASLDKMTQGALIDCVKVLSNAIDDLRRSSEKVDKIEVGRLSHNIAAVRNWLSATVTYKENCIDALWRTCRSYPLIVPHRLGEIRDEVMAMLKSPSELLSNGLAMITNTEPKLLGEESLEEIPYVVPAAVGQKLTVAKDGSGQFKTITSALNSLPQESDVPVVVLVKGGVYNEYVVIPRGMNNVALVGEGPLITRISGNRSNRTGFSILNSATLVVEGDNFFAKNIGIENTAPRVEQQAVAVRVNGDKAVFYNVHIDGHQDTLFAQTYHHFYRHCRISGTVDFIFGNALAVFQKCKIVMRIPFPGQSCTITAQGRTQPTDPGVTVIQGCTITAEHVAKPPVPAYLGRPWKLYSRTIIMQSGIGGFISPKGWLPWNPNSAVGLDTLYYGEWGNCGGGADLRRRVGWEGFHKMTMKIAESFTAQKVFVNDDWVRKSGVPYVAGILPKCGF